MVCFQFICSTSLKIVISCALPLMVPKIFVALERVRDIEIYRYLKISDFKHFGKYCRTEFKNKGIRMSLDIIPKNTNTSSLNHILGRQLATISSPLTPAKSVHLIIPLNELNVALQILGRTSYKNTKKKIPILPKPFNFLS